MAVPKIDELIEPPVVGKYYEVPCLAPIDMEALRLRFGEESWVYRTMKLPIPILPPVHSDPELGVPEDHLHVDLRFCSDGFLQKWNTFPNNFPLTDVNLSKLTGLVATYHDVYRTLFQIEWRKLKCRRVMPRFYELGLWSEPKANYMKSFVGQKIDKCGKCPHRGMYLLNLPREQGNPGQVVCRGHGLVIDLDKRQVVSLGKSK